MRRLPSPAFTLIELLVVLAIIAVVLGLMLPAIQRVRKTVQRVHCASNERQIGIAAHIYNADCGMFPAGTSQQQGSYLSSWLTALLPYIEQDSLSDQTRAAYAQSPQPFANPPHVGLATPMPLYECPADPAATQLGFAAREKLNVAFTSYLGVEGQDLYARDGVFYFGSRTRIEDMLKGTSETLMAGERPPSADDQYGWWYAGAGQGFSGSLDSTLGVQEINVLPYNFAPCVPGPYQFGPGDVNNQCDMFTDQDEDTKCRADWNLKTCYNGTNPGICTTNLNGDACTCKP